MTQLETALVEITSFLDRSGLPYMLIGGLAVAMWGEPRATLDVDLSVWVDPAGFDDAVQAILNQLRDGLAGCHREMPESLQLRVRQLDLFADRHRSLLKPDTPLLTPYRIAPVVRLHDPKPRRGARK